VTLPEVVLRQPPGRPWGSANVSPFCIKLETYLRMAGVPFRAEPGDPFGSPSGKMPFAVLGGETVADSQVIVERLEAEHGEPLDAWLDDERAARARLIRRALEEAYYFVALWLRWGDDAGYAVVAPTFRALLPSAIAWLAVPVIRRGIVKSLHAQGTGRHPAARIHEMGKRDIDALARVFEGPYVLGARPSTCDATVFAFVEITLGFPCPSPVREHMAAQAPLVAYHAMMRDEYWGDAGLGPLPS
jgi:glutathione S-transferase